MCTFWTNSQRGNSHHQLHPFPRDTELDQYAGAPAGMVRDIWKSSARKIIAQPFNLHNDERRKTKIRIAHRPRTFENPTPVHPLHHRASIILPVHPSLRGRDAPITANLAVTQYAPSFAVPYRSRLAAPLNTAGSVDPFIDGHAARRIRPVSESVRFGTSASASGIPLDDVCGSEAKTSISGPMPLDGSPPSPSHPSRTSLP
jgi:hypothetical protein